MTFWRCFSTAWTIMGACIMFSSASIVSMLINGLLFRVRSDNEDAYSSATSFATLDIFTIDVILSWQFMKPFTPHFTVKQWNNVRLITLHYFVKKPYATPNGTAWKIATFPTLRFTIKNDFHATNKLPSSFCIKHDTIFVP